MTRQTLPLPTPRTLTPQEAELTRAPQRIDLPTLGTIPSFEGPPPTHRPRLLLIDDNPEFLATTEATWKNFYKEWARLEFFHFSDANREELFSLLAESINGDPRDRFQTVYIDLNLSESGKGGGIGLIQALYEYNDRLRFTPFVIVTASGDIEKELEARRVGAIRFFTKTAPNNSAGTNGILGTFVQRMIAESLETFEQLEDLIWAEASGRLAKALLTKDWKEACQDTIEFIQDNFRIDALYVRQTKGNNLFEQIHENDDLGFGASTLNIQDVPFVKSFIEAKDPEPYQFFDDLSPKTAGHKYYDRMKSHRVVIARIAVRSRTLGFLTLYRNKTDRLFRRQDANGLSRLADQLSGAILQEDNKARLREREIQMLKGVRAFDGATTEQTIFCTLRDSLFDTFAATMEHPDTVLESSIRYIQPGTNRAERPCNNRGYVDRNPARDVILENMEGSSVANAIWKGQGLLEPDLVYERDKDRFIFPRKDIRCAITAPIITQGVCFGAAILECLVPNKFDAQDLEFTEALCESAAAAILRLRTRAFLDDTADLAARLAEPGDEPTGELVKQVCSLLLRFTGASEITYLDQPSDQGVWRLSDAFKFPGERISNDIVAKWQLSISERWTETYVHKVLSHGEDSGWTAEPEDIPIDDALVGGRRPGEKTRSQAVIVLREKRGAPPEAIISLLFLHRYAIADAYIPTVKTLGNLLSALLRQRRTYKRLFGLNTIQEQEARLGQLFGQVRHGLVSQLARIRQSIVAAEESDLSWQEAGSRVKVILNGIGQDINRAKYLIKAPVPVQVDLGELWSTTAEQLEAIAEEYDGRIVEPQMAGEVVTTDPDILQAILYNLVDNSLRHGGPKTTVTAKAVRSSDSVSIIVTDTGKGIPESIEQRLFDVGQTTSSRSTGLGLYLSRSRARDLDGDLSLKSTGLGGTTFAISLPLNVKA